MKKLISIILMAMLLMTTVPFSTFAADEEEKTYIIYNSADGAATTQTPVYSADDNGKYEDVRYYVDTNSTGTNSNKNEQNYGAIWTGKDKAKGRDYVSFMRFPLSDIPEQEIATSVKLSVTLWANVDIATLTELKVYGGFTDAAFGEAITYGKTFDELMALDCAGSVTLSAGSHAANTTLEIDITDYVKTLIQSDAESVDLALAMPDAEVLITLYNVTRKYSTAPASYKPHLTVETVYYVPENGGQVSITDSVADGLSLDIYFEKEGYYYITTTGCGNGESNAKLSLNGDDAVENILKHDEVGEYMIGDPFILNEGMNNVEISLMDASNTEAQLTKISFKPNQAPVFDKSDISSMRPLVGESVSLAVSAVDLESALEKVSYKVIPEGADEEDRNEEEMTLENGEYTADITFPDIGKYSVKLFAYDKCGAKCEKTLYVNSVGVKAENAAVTEETVSDGIKLTGELDFYNNSGTEKKVTLIIAVYDENNMMIAQENVAAVLTASVDAQPISVETLFQPPATGTWSAELMLWDSLLDMNSLSDVTEHN